MIGWFNEHWASAEVFDLADLFDQRIREHPPELIYARMLAEYYGQGLEADTAFDGVTEMLLTDWQKAGAETAFEMMQTYGGALLADDVGLGKTHTAAKVISHYTRRRERGVGAPWVLVVCPAAMESTWESVLHEQGVASRVKVLSYDKARRQIHENLDEFDKYAMVVCDEAHHLCNPGAKRTKEIDRLIAGNGTPKHALMMTATPVNNGIGDMESIISLAVRDDETFRPRGIPSLRGYFNAARRRDKQGELRPEHADLIGSFDPTEAKEGRDRYDLIISTDTLAEGVNLQAAGRCINYDLPWNPMRVVQRFGRVDRLRSPHSKVDLRCFYPGDRIDDWLRLLGKLNRKLSAADAAVGVEEILPSDHPASGGKTFNEEQSVREGNEDLASLIDNEIDRQARSPQEMRYRLGTLRDELGSDVDDLPHTAGSGFINKSAAVVRPAYVFCLRMGEDGPVWFRTVFCDDDWKPLPHGNRQADETPSLDLHPHEETAIDDKHSLALRLADPDPDGEGPAPRHLPRHIYAGAFTAWERARAHAHNAYVEKLGEEQSSKPPEAFKKASEELEHLGQRSKPVRDWLATVPLSKKPEEAINKKLKEYNASHRQPARLLKAVEKILDEHGIVARAPRDGLKPGLRLEDIRLICWQAVCSG